jgi:hypothetical protein
VQYHYHLWRLELNAKNQKVSLPKIKPKDNYSLFFQKDQLGNKSLDKEKSQPLRHCFVALPNNL